MPLKSTRANPAVAVVARKNPKLLSYFCDSGFSVNGHAPCPDIEVTIEFEGGKLMNGSLTVQKMRHFVAVALILLTLVFTIGPIGSVTSAQTRRYRRNRTHRTFWQKHRDKLTVAGTTLGGAAVGGLAGGKKGAAIGSLVGAGGGAVYTYKLRKRHRRY